MSCLRCQHVSLRPIFVTVLSKRGSRNLCVCVRDSLFMDKVFFTLLRVFVGVARGQTQKKKAQNYLYRPFPLQGWTQPLKSAKDVTFCCRWTHHIVHLFNLKSCKTALYLCLFVFLQISSDDRRETERLVACRVFLLRRLEHLRTL